jgi:hypothetical protein
LSVVALNETPLCCEVARPIDGGRSLGAAPALATPWPTAAATAPAALELERRPRLCRVRSGTRFLNESQKTGCSLGVAGWEYGTPAAARDSSIMRSTARRESSKRTVSTRTHQPRGMPSAGSGRRGSGGEGRCCGASAPASLPTSSSSHAAAEGAGRGEEPPAWRGDANALSTTLAPLLSAPRALLLPPLPPLPSVASSG